MIPLTPVYTAPVGAPEDLDPKTFAVVRWPDGRTLVDHPSAGPCETPFAMTLELKWTADPEVTDAVIRIEHAPRDILERLPPMFGYAAQADLTDRSRDRISRALADLLDLPGEPRALFVDDGFFGSDTKGAEGYTSATITAHLAGNVLDPLSSISNHRLIRICQAPEIVHVSRAATN